MMGTNHRTKLSKPKLSPALASTLKKLEAGQVVGGIIGMGYVGLPLALEFCQSGYRTIGFDTDPKKKKKLNNGQSYIHHIPSKLIDPEIKAGKLEATTDFSRLNEPDLISICVPTPLNQYREPDLSFVAETAHSIAKTLRPGQVIVLESTTYPGTTDELVRPILEATGLQAGKDFALAYSPEREDPANPDFTARSIPKVLGGTTVACLYLAQRLYDLVFDTLVPVSSTQAAEMAKLLENIYRCINIAMVNELKMLTDRMKIDIWEVIAAAATKPFGFKPFYPGPGLGGHCIPIDPYYLTWKAREYGFQTRFIELAGDINTNMPRFVVSKVVEALNEKRIVVRGAKVMVLGVAYKPNVDDVRESPALEVVELLREWGVRVTYHDPYIPVYPKGRKGDLGLSSIPLTARNLSQSDAVLILTDHACVDYDFVVQHASLVIDTRNATRDVKNGRNKIRKA